MSENTTAKKTGVDKLIDGIEKVCNKLPPPAILFCWLFLITAIIGCIFSVMGVALTNPASGEVVTSANLFSKDGVDWILGNMVKNFTGFAPLGLVITMTLGIGLCEESGMLISMLNSSLKNVPAAMIPYVIAFVGTVGNIASDTAMVVIPPMAAIVYMGVGKHPVVGMMVGYAGAQAGFTANLMVAGTDTLLQGLTNDAIKAFIPDTTFQVDPTCNWFFMIFSTFLCAAVIGFCSVHMIEPRFGKYEGAGEAKLEEVTPQQKKGLNAAGLTAIVYIIIIAIGFFTGLLSDELLLKGVDERMGADHKRVILRLAAVESLSVHIAVEVDGYMILILNASVLNSNQAGIFLADTVDFALDILIQDVCLHSLNLNALVLAEGYFRLNSNDCAVNNRLSVFQLIDADGRTGNDLKTALLCCLRICGINHFIDRVLVEYADAVHFLNHFKRRFSLTEARDVESSLVLLVCVLDCSRKLLCRHLHRKLCRILL